jgi:hypothetical protein
MRTYIIIATVLAAAITGIYLSNRWIFSIGLLTLCFLPRRKVTSIHAPIKPTGQPGRRESIVEKFIKQPRDAIWYIRLVLIIFLAFFVATPWTSMSDFSFFWGMGDIGEFLY